MTPFQLIHGHSWLNDAGTSNYAFIDQLLAWPLDQILIYLSLDLVVLNIHLDTN